MEKRGFTLVELLGVIVIMAVIFVLVAPSVTNVISQGRKTAYQSQLKSILNAAYDFSLKNLSYLPDGNNINYVTLGQLKSEGLVDVNIINPKNNKEFPDNLVISIKKESTNYKTDETSMINGNYLYTVEIAKLNDGNINDKMPTIKLETVGSEDINLNSNNNYVLLLNLNDEVPKIIASATSWDGNDLTDKIKYYNLFQDPTLNAIDTSLHTIYKIKYSVVDNEGNASFAVLNIIIGDEIPPTVTFPKITIISKDDLTFDLLKDVSCKDNSGFCDIEYIDTITYGTIGTYVVEYTIKDPNGNTITEKRSITVE